MFSSTKTLDAEHNFKLVVVGGGAGGCGTASKFVNKFGSGEVAVIEPNTMHYYQPMWTLVRYPPTFPLTPSFFNFSRWEEASKVWLNQAGL